MKINIYPRELCFIDPISPTFFIRDNGIITEEIDQKIFNYLFIKTDEIQMFSSFTKDLYEIGTEQ